MRGSGQARRNSIIPERFCVIPPRPMTKARRRKYEVRAIDPSSSTATLVTGHTKGCEAPDARSENLPSLGARSAARSTVGGPERATDEKTAPFGAAHSKNWCSRRRSTERRLRGILWLHGAERRPRPRSDLPRCAIDRSLSEHVGLRRLGASWQAGIDGWEL